MTRMTRRDFLAAAGAATAMAALPLGSAWAGGKVKARVVVVGGGFGGATCARYIRMLDPAVEVTLVDRKAVYHTCPFSNTVLGGMNPMKYIARDYANLRDRYGVKVVQDEVTGIDPAARKIALKSGKSLGYDRAVVSPGIGFKWGAIEGYDPAAAEFMPHAWQAGEQTDRLLRQLQAMDDGGTVIIAPPGNPFRCPPGPYERASLIAHYLKTHKPKSKILILDAKDKFAKQGLFEAGWEALYPGILEWEPGSQVTRVDAKAGVVYTGEQAHKGAVVNVIPPQTAAPLAHGAGLTNDKGWCPVDQKTFESSVHAGIHVIGDSAIAGKMPKSGYAANSQAKVCAQAVVALVNGVEPGTPSWINTCYSLVGPDYGISVAAVYRLTPEGIMPVEGAGGVSPGDGDVQSEAYYAESWYLNITADSFG